jgi:eukaryotic-like serine/threonine-protein kinase
LIYRFGKFQLDDELFELRFGSEVRSLPRKSFDLLRYLVSNHGRVVTKSELFAHLWEGEHVSDSVLPVNIRTIRRALGDEASEEILKTVRGRGYVIACAVERFDGSIRQTREPSSANPSFVGRGELMETLRAEFRAMLSGQGRTVLLYGEDGIGKSRIVDEFARWARGETALVLQTQCSADPGAPPFWPIVQLLRGGGSLLQGPELATALEGTSFDPDRARARVTDFFTNGYRSSSSLDTRVFELSRILLRIIQLTSPAVPIVFVLDDLHLAEEPTLRVLASICRELPKHRVLALGTYQETELRRNSSTSARLIGSVAGLDGVRQIGLRGLDTAAIEEFVGSELGIEPSRALAQELSARTEGNPFFLREMMRMIQADGAVRSGAMPDLSRLGVPHGVRESIRRRLDGLSSECREVMAWASVIGRRFSFPVLSEVCRLPTARLLSLLGEAAESRVIGTHEGPDTPLPVGEFSFTHALIRQTIYEEVSGAELVLRHRSVGEALERMHGRPTYEDVLGLAYHFFEAAPGGDIDRASDYCVRAARGANVRFKYDEAVRHFDRALRAEHLRVPRDEVRYSSVRLSRADALWRAGRYAEAQEEFLSAAEVVREAKQYDMLGLVATGLAGWPRFERMVVGEEGQAELAQVVAVTEEALRGIAPERDSMRARLLSVLARAGQLHWQGKPISDLALTLARQSGEPRALFQALLARIATLRSPIHVKETLDLATHAVQIGRDLKAQLRTFAAYEARIPILWMLGDMAGADRDIAAAALIAERVGVPAYEYSVGRFQLGRAIGNGELIRARSLLDRIAEVGDRAGDRGGRVGQLLIRLWLLEAEGRADSAGRAVDALAAGGHFQGQHAAAFVAAFYQTLGNRERCAEYFERAAATDFEEPDTQDAWLWHLAICADVCAFLNDARRAERLYELIYPFEHLNITNVRLRCYRGSAAYTLALLATTLDRRDDAQRHFEVALEFNQRLGARINLLLTQYYYGRLLRNGSPAERRQSRALLSEALRSASEIGLQAMLGGRIEVPSI